jgi:BatD DUF11 like domain
MSMPRTYLQIGILISAIGFLSTDVLADSPSVTAVLSNSEAAVGQMVQLEIRVRGAGEATVPDIAVDGLEIHGTGTSRQFEMRNFTTTSSVSYNYTVLPLKPGTFKIPEQTIRVGGNSLRTPGLTLHVVDAARNPTARGAPNPSGGTALDPSRLAFAELVVPKKTAYVGEMIPIVLRVGFFVRGQPAEAPQIKAQGFTMQKVQAPEQARVELVNGERCEVITFKTAIAPTKTGKTEIAAEMPAVVLVPRQRSRSPGRDPFDMDDPFSDPFFSSPFRQQQRLTVKSDPVSLEVKPLPPGGPASFSGAVGNFNMTVEANPKSVQVGDPITATSTIAGRGNFDRVTAPALEDDRGWHKYPPSSKFKQDDEVGISGTKTFETVLSPNEKKQQISPFVFSFFDPAKESYVTLRNDAIPISVQGGSAPAAVAATAPKEPGSATPATVATKATPKPRDILYQLTELSAQGQSFTPVYARRNFWLAQIIPLLGFLGFIGWKIRKARLDNREAQRIAALHHEAAELLRNLRRNDVAPQTYFSQAARAVQVKTALARNLDPNVVDVETAAATFGLDEKSHDQLRRLFARKDELRYSGAHNGAETISPESRREVLELVENLRA